MDKAMEGDSSKDSSKELDKDLQLSAAIAELSAAIAKLQELRLSPSVIEYAQRNPEFLSLIDEVIEKINKLNAIAESLDKQANTKQEAADSILAIELGTALAEFIAKSNITDQGSLIYVLNAFAAQHNTDSEKQVNLDLLPKHAARFQLDSPPGEPISTLTLQRTTYAIIVMADSGKGIIEIYQKNPVRNSWLKL